MWAARNQLLSTAGPQVASLGTEAHWGLMHEFCPFLGGFEEAGHRIARSLREPCSAAIEPRKEILHALLEGIRSGGSLLQVVADVQTPKSVATSINDASERSVKLE